MELKPITTKDALALYQYYRNCNYGLCEYAVVTKLMWKEILCPSYAIVADCLVVGDMFKGQLHFEYPVPGPDGDVEAALLAMERHCIENGIAFAMTLVPGEKICSLVARYPYLRITDTRSWQDYIYHRDDLQFFAGRRYSGQRNHINKFHQGWPEAEFRPLSAKDKEAIALFWAEFTATYPKADDPGVKKELALAKKMFNLMGKPFVLAGGMFDGDKLIGLSLGEICGDTLIVHIEKAIYTYTGVYPALVQAFVDCFGGNCAWVNREDDAGQKGLRTSKLQYGPDHLGAKYRLYMENELMHHCQTIPTLTTQNLTLDAMTQEDIGAYNKLVLDKERNVFWGYDDVAGLGAPVAEDSFFNVAKRDFEAKFAVNFAVRLDGQFIGEAVLYNFDYCGGAELGCRILPEFADHGYGVEAFSAVADWGLYTIQLRRVVAKCFKENKASYKMLSSCMRKKSEDDTFYHFEKLV